VTGEQPPLPIYPLATQVWPGGEVKGGLSHSQRVLPARTCTCSYHWPGWKRQAELDARQRHWWLGSSGVTRSELAETARAAAKGYDVDGRKAEAKAMRLYARRLEGRLR